VLFRSPFYSKRVYDNLTFSDREFQKDVKEMIDEHMDNFSCIVNEFGTCFTYVLTNPKNFESLTIIFSILSAKIITILAELKLLLNLFVIRRIDIEELKIYQNIFRECEGLLRDIEYGNIDDNLIEEINYKGKTYGRPKATKEINYLVLENVIKNKTLELSDSFKDLDNFVKDFLETKISEEMKGSKMKERMIKYENRRNQFNITVCTTIEKVKKTENYCPVLLNIYENIYKNVLSIDEKFDYDNFVMQLKMDIFFNFLG
jgi:hypothetical protein